MVGIPVFLGTAREKKFLYFHLECQVLFMEYNVFRIKHKLFFLEEYFLNLSNFLLWNTISVISVPYVFNMEQ